MPRAYVGLGGSAGSLAAFQNFLGAVQPGSGLAYILIPHLAPNRPSMLAELLAKRTTMPVAQVDHEMVARPDHVYIIAPNTDLTITDGTLRPCKANHPEGARTAVYRFFSDLAADQGRRAVGIILSGTGSDGSEGLREIKARGGFTLVQAAETADYPGMPRSAIATGMADRVLPVEDMPAVLRRFVGHPYLSGAAVADETNRDDAVRNDIHGQILDLLIKRHGHDFRPYKAGTVERRIDRRMTIHHVQSLDAYLTLLREDNDESTRLFQDLLIGVTQFFREPKAFEALERDCLKPLIANAVGRREPLRIWVPACATGEEAYSIAIGLLEVAETISNPLRLELFATDIDARALNAARAGHYPETIAEHISAVRLKRWFNKTDYGYQVKKELRERLVIAVQNLITDPPFSKLDLISCRNVLIYLSKSTQSQLLRVFHFALRPTGHLFLGNSESVGDSGGLFMPVSRRWRLYRRIEGSDLPHENLAWLGHGRSSVRPAIETADPIHRIEKLDRKLEHATRELLLHDFAPACAVVDERFNILFLHGDIDAYLVFASGAPSNNLLDLARRGLRGRLRHTVKRLVHGSRVVIRTEARVLRKRQYHPIQIMARSFLPLGFERQYVLVCLQDIEHSRPKPAAADGNRKDADIIAQLEYELRSSQEELQGTVEAVEASNEELKTANEEAVSINEELQSSNEELESSKEELQSLNEELNTLNAQLQEKVDDVEVANTDIVNLLESTEIATIFLDSECRIKRFTPSAPRLFNFIEADLGRQIGDISHCFLRHFDLRDEADTVQRSGETLEFEEQTEDDRWYLRRMTPYRTPDGNIDGVVLAFLDVTPLKRAERRLERSDARFRALYDNNPSMYVSLDCHGTVQSINRFGAQQLGFEPAQLEGRPFVDLLETGDTFEQEIEQCRNTPGRPHSWELALVTRQRHSIWVRIHAHMVQDPEGTPAILMACQDISTQKQLSEEARFYATHDALTGLINRREFERLLAAAVESAQVRRHAHALCYFDLDNFKLVNDTYGHEAGDELLRELAARMRRGVRQRDVLARLGGDEFAVLMEHCDTENARKIAENLVALVRDHEFVWHGYRLHVGCCAGLVSVTESSGDLRAIVRAADAACFEAKDHGANSVHMHTESDSLIAHRHAEMSWANRLRDALQQKRLELYAQPIVSLRDDDDTPAYETLLRLRDESGALIEASEFMGPALRYGLVREIDYFALTQALEFLAAHASRLKPFRWLSINISAMSMNHPEFLEFVVEAVSAAHIDPARLCFEITETTVISNLGQAQQFMQELKTLGCSFALDDFGTGLSSFQYLRLLPAEYVKIDGSFIRDLSDDAVDRAMVEAVQSVSRKMGKATIAECVESEQIASIVREIGIDYAQGFHYAMPQPIAAMLLADESDGGPAADSP